MKNIKISDYEIAIYEDGPVGISLSAGADSALLLYILMSNIRKHIHIYTILAPNRRAPFESHADAVVKTCSELTGNTNYTHHKIHPPKQMPDVVFRYLDERYVMDQLEIIYFGLTNFPPRSVYLEFDEQQPRWHNEFRDDTVIKPLYGIRIPVKEKTDLQYISGDPDHCEYEEISIDEKVYVPFVNLNKKDIAKMYHELGIVETVFPVSRSCENDNHLGSHCGKCWWCNERKWAFGFLE